MFFLEGPWVDLEVSMEFLISFKNLRLDREISMVALKNETRAPFARIATGSDPYFFPSAQL